MASGAELGGTGTVGAITVPSGATVAPGTSIGSVTQILPALQQSVTGTFLKTYSVSVTQTLPQLGQSITGLFIPPLSAGAISQTLPTLIQSLVGTYVSPGRTGSIDQTLPILIQSLTGTFGPGTVIATIDQILPFLIQELWETRPEAFPEGIIWIFIEQGENLIWIDPLDDSTTSDEVII
jgi:hypothetical protein